jgi:hypothetical protein
MKRTNTSEEARAKLQAVLDRDRDDACAAWFADLSVAQQQIAGLAKFAYENGQQDSAETIAARLPTTPWRPPPADR